MSVVSATAIKIPDQPAIPPPFFHSSESAWGGVWTRPDLDRRTRSLITIGILAALGRREELILHLKASKNTGATPEEILEALLHVAVYAGVPAANTAVAIAKGILAPEPGSVWSDEPLKEGRQ